MSNKVEAAYPKTPAGTFGVLVDENGMPLTPQPYPHKVNVMVDGSLDSTPHIPGVPAFTDSEGEVYTAPVEGGEVIALTGRTDHGVYVVRFFKEDALKIIALIAEAAK